MKELVGFSKDAGFKVFIGFVVFRLKRERKRRVEGFDRQIDCAGLLRGMVGLGWASASREFGELMLLIMFIRRRYNIRLIILNLL